MKRRTEPTGTESDYWTRFLASRNLIGFVSDEEEIPTEPGAPTPQLTLGEDQIDFINRVVNKLTYSPEMMKHYRQGLTDVFLGKTSMDEWFEKTRVQAGLKEIDFLKLIREELKPLKGEDVNMLKRSFDKRIADLSRYYS